MSIIRFDPFRDPFRDLDRLTSQLVSGTRTPAPMPMDAWRSADGYHVALDLPGVDPGSTELTVERNSLTVQATRQAMFGEGDQVLTAERPQGSFTRHLILGDDVDAENVRTDDSNGVLNLTIPVKQTAEPRRIEIGHDKDKQGGGRDQPQVIERDQRGTELPSAGHPAARRDHVTQQTPHSAGDPGTSSARRPDVRVPGASARSPAASDDVQGDTAGLLIGWVWPGRASRRRGAGSQARWRRSFRVGSAWG
jgi:HSP20 family protein